MIDQFYLILLPFFFSFNVFIIRKHIYICVYEKKKELPLRVDVHLVIALTLKIACGLYMIVNISSVDLFKALIISFI